MSASDWLRARVTDSILVLIRAEHNCHNSRMCVRGLLARKSTEAGTGPLRRREPSPGPGTPETEEGSVTNSQSPAAVSCYKLPMPAPGLTS